MSLDFHITESRDGNTVCLTLTGELTMASVGALDSRLKELREARTPVRLNLSQLEFMDSSGLTVVLRSLSESRRSGWPLTVDRDVSPFVEGRFKQTGVDRLLGW